MVGRPKVAPVHQYFEYSSAAKKSTCKIDECGFQLAGNHAPNLERHVASKHKDVFKNLQDEKAAEDSKRKTSNTDRPSCTSGLSAAKQQKLDTFMVKKISVSLDAKTLLDACVDMVTVNGRPFSVVEDSGFRKIINPILDGLEKASGKRLGLGENKVKNEVTQRAAVIRDEVKNQLKGRLVSLKIDCATRQDRQVIGINVQYIESGHVIVKTLAVRELYERHTAAHLKEIITDVVHDFEITKDQIYTFTTDNGANMLKTVSMFDEPDNNELLVAEVESGTLDEEDTTVIDDISAEFVFKTGVYGLKCAAHTLQLGVIDFLKEKNISSSVSKVREIVKFLRTPSQMMLIRKLELHKPIVDCVTRWSSTADMLERCVKLKGHISSLQTEGALTITVDWMRVESILTLLEPVRRATNELQQQDITLGDFYGLYIKMRTTIDGIICSIANAKQTLLKCLEKREENILANHVVLASVFLDTRYRILLSPVECASARHHLFGLFRRLEQLNTSDQNELCSTPNVDDPPPGTHTDDQPDIDAFEEMLRRADEERLAMSSSTAGGISASATDVDLQEEIERFAKQPRLSKEASILAFWHNEINRVTYPKLAKLADIVNAVPPTQVSVERAFSALKFILSPQRARLSSDMLNNILIVRLNSPK